jgi:hypothetical protein
VSRANRTVAATAAAAAPETSSQARRGGAVTASGPRALPQVGTAGTVAAPAMPGEPRTAAVLPDRRCFFAGQVGLGERPLLGQVRAGASGVAAGPGGTVGCPRSGR